MILGEQPDHVCVVGAAPLTNRLVTVAKVIVESCNVVNQTAVI